MDTAEVKLLKAISDNPKPFIIYGVMICIMKSQLP